MAYDGSNTTQTRYGVPYMPYGSFADRPASAVTGSIVKAVSFSVAGNVAVSVTQHKESGNA